VASLNVLISLKGRNVSPPPRRRREEAVLDLSVWKDLHSSSERRFSTRVSLMFHSS
jgi:hypothetical protein